MNSFSFPKKRTNEGSVADPGSGVYLGLTGGPGSGSGPGVGAVNLVQVSVVTWSGSTQATGK